MKKRKQISFYRIEIIITFIFLVSLLLFFRTDTFIGNLEEFDTIIVMDSHNDYDIIRVVNGIEETTSLAIYSKDTSYTFAFYQEDEQVFFIHSELLEDDYYLFNIQGYDETTLSLKVYNGDTLVDSLSFHNTISYSSASTFMRYNDSFKDLLLEDITISKSMLLSIFIDDSDARVVIILILLFFVSLLFIPFRRIFNKLSTDKSKKILEKVFIHVFSSIIFFGITILILVSIYGESEESTSNYDNRDYIYEETDDFKIDTSIGIQKVYWITGSRLEVVYRLKLITFDESLKYTGILTCGEDQFGQAGSIFIDNFSFDQVWEQSLDGACEDSNTFHIDVRDIKTALLLYQTEEYTLYKDVDDVITVFELETSSKGFYISLGIFMFHFLITATALDYFIIWIDKKGIFPLIKNDKTKSKH